jgi:4'-phosphopantetheinyl transferase
MFRATVIARASLAEHRPAQAALPVPAGVDLWVARDDDFTAAQLARAAPLLAPEETTRQQQMRFVAGRHQALLTRLMQRTVLSAYSREVPPQDWRFVLGPTGKPSLASQFASLGWQFNLAHTAGLVAMVVGRDALLGVDVETSGRVSLPVARRYFSPTEIAQLDAEPEDARPRRFLQLWTLKEAYLKATGSGIAGGLGRMTFAFDPAGGISFERADDARAADWRFRQFDLAGTHWLSVAALPGQAVESLPVTLRVFGGQCLAATAAAPSGEEQRAET